MYLIKSGVGRVRHIAVLIFLLNFFAAIFIYQSDALAKSPAISDESVDFLTKTGQTMAEVADAVKPAIVNISTTKTEKMPDMQLSPFLEDPFFKKFFGDKFKHPEGPKEHKTSSLGSGVIVSHDGYILTNNHVVKDADEIEVLLSDKRKFKGKIIGNDPKTDISVIKIDANNLSALEWGNSDKLRVGEIVLAVGNPYGLNQTITMGIVSAVGRANVGIADYEDFIQTDAAINPGNSGGALVNAKGELIGINTAIISNTGGSQGIGFAIPSNMAKIVMANLVKSGKVVRGWLGVSIQPITAELAKQFNLKEETGALVGDVIEGSPAEKAGIVRGDVITEYNSKKIDEPYNLRNTVASTAPGETAMLKVIRNGKNETIKVVIGELPSDEKISSGIEFKNALKGINVSELSPDLYKQMNLPEKIKGVMITDVDPNSSAYEKLMEGDIIQEVNRKAVTNLQGFKEIVSGIKAGENILLLVFRKGTSVYVTVAP